MGHHKHIPQLLTLNFGRIKACVPKDYTDEQIIEFGHSLNIAKNCKLMVGEVSACICFEGKKHVFIDIDRA